MKHVDTIQINGETWKVLAVGATVVPRTYVHIANVVWLLYPTGESQVAWDALKNDGTGRADR